MPKYPKYVDDVVVAGSRKLVFVTLPSSIKATSGKTGLGYFIVAKSYPESAVGAVAEFIHNYDWTQELFDRLVRDESDEIYTRELNNFIRSAKDATNNSLR